MSKSYHFFIVVPSYNQGDFIEQTLESITSQAGKNIKVKCLIRDGGSTDQTLAILKRFKGKIEYVSKSDKGQSDAINQGVNKVLTLSKNPETDIFAYLNSDDYYLPEAFKNVVKAFESSPTAKWLIGECQIVNADGKPIQYWVQKYKTIARWVMSKQWLFVLNPIPQPAVFIRVSALQRSGFFNESLRFVMDYEYWLRLWQRCGRPILVEKTLAAFRIHGQSKGSLSYRQQFSEQLLVAQRFTRNPVWLFLQRLHNMMIIGMYKIMK